MLLQESLEGTDGNRYPMAGALPGECRRQQRLCRFGYARYTALSDGLLCGRGESLPIHSFHYWDSTAPGDGFLAQKPGRDGSWREGVMTGSLYAGFGHLHLCHGELAKRFVARCRGAQKERRYVSRLQKVHPVPACILTGQDLAGQSNYKSRCV